MQQKNLYLPALDGLRLLAFILVFIHHLPVFPENTIISEIQKHGWVGVELFFVISSFLFFHLFLAEHQKDGKINIRRFYARRVLRIYPLLIVFVLSMLYFYQERLGYDFMLRAAGIVFCVDNLLSWVRGYNVSVPFSPHLWTLSFEFQIYAVVPLIFLAFKKFGPKTFAIMMVCGFLLSFSLRMAAFHYDVQHPIVWVTPFFRPESVMLGMILSAGYMAAVPGWMFGIAAVLAGLAFFMTSVPWGDAHGAAFSYPLAAVMCTGLVGFSLKNNLFAKLLAWRPLKYLGSVSFGLYVFHFLALDTGVRTAVSLGLRYDSADNRLYYLVCAVVGLAMSVSLAIASFHLLEKPFLRMKRRLSSVESSGAATGYPYQVAEQVT